MKYDIKSIYQKQDQLERAITDSIQQKLDSQLLCNAEQDNSSFFDMLPIVNEDGLTEFENKLTSDKTFRSKLVYFSIIKYIHDFKTVFIFRFQN